MKQPLAETKVLNAGLVALVSIDGDDETIANTARTSYRNNNEAYTPEQNAQLIDYLIRHQHSTPLEFAGATFYLVMPLFVAAQFQRHRTASINQESLRYVAPRDEYYIPEESECKTQSKTSKQGSSTELVNYPGNTRSYIDIACTESQSDYEHLTETGGLSKEIARTVLPVGQYTAFYWRANLRNILGLLELRVNPHAQEQIRVYAEAMLEQLKPYFSVTIAAWVNHRLDAVIFSADEIGILRELLFSEHLQEYLDVLEMSHRNLRPTRFKEFKAKLEGGPLSQNENKS